MLVKGSHLSLIIARPTKERIVFLNGAIPFQYKPMVKLGGPQYKARSEECLLRTSWSVLQGHQMVLLDLDLYSLDLTRT